MNVSPHTRAAVRLRCVRLPVSAFVLAAALVSTPLAAAHAGTPSPTAKPSDESCSFAPEIRVLDSTIAAGGEARVEVRGTTSLELLAYTRPQGPSDYRVVRTTSGPGGAVFALRPPANTRLFVRTTGCPERTGESDKSSGSVVINVRTTLSLFAERHGRQDYTFSGDSLPARAGGLIVSLYRVTEEGRNVLTAQGRADESSGEWSISRRFTGTGRFGFVARTGQDIQNAPGASNVRSTLIY